MTPKEIQRLAGLPLPPPVWRVKATSSWVSGVGAASLLIAVQAAARQGQGVETIAHAIGGDAASAVDSEGGPSPQWVQGTEL